MAGPTHVRIHGATRTSHRGAALAVLCLAAFIINLDTTIVNVALPSLVRESRRARTPPRTRNPHDHAQP